MRNLSLTIVFLLLFFNVQSQNPLETKLDSMMVNLNTTSLTTGVLYDRVMPLAHLNTYNDSINVANAGLFKRALTELYKASREQKFVSNDEIKVFQALDEQKHVVDIGLINAEFQQLNYNLETVMEGGLDISNEKFEKINNSKPEFINKSLLVVAPLKQYVVGPNVTYRFNENLILQENSSRSLASLTANFETGDDFIVYDNGTLLLNEITIDYAEEGYKTLTFTADFDDGSSLNTQGILHVKLSYHPPTAAGIKDSIGFTSTIPFSDYNTNNNIYGKLDYRIFYGNSQNKLLKPIVIIDGFDPGDKRKIEDSDSELPNDMHKSIDEMVTYLEPGNPIPVKMIPILRGLGYDIVVVNHPSYLLLDGLNTRLIDGGADYIERNGLAHVTLYEALNAELATNGSTEELVIVGPSMGGQISRYALAYMEKNGINHNTRLWISIDSPHLGANIPMGIQSIVKLLADFEDSDEANAFFNDQIRSVAASQQLIEQYKVDNDPGFLNNGSDVRQQYNANLFGNGVSGSSGYPQLTRNIAIVNGSLSGVKNGVEGVEDFRVHGYLQQLWWDVKVVELSSNYMPSSGSSAQVARLWRLFKPTRTRNFTNINPNGTMDVVPGGFFNSENILAASVQGSGIDQTNWWVNGLNFFELSLGVNGLIFGDTVELHTNLQIHTFIPTVSALGFYDSNFDWSDKLDRDLTCNDEIPFDTYFGPENNEQHTSFTAESVAWLLEELAGNEQSPTVYREFDAYLIEGPDKMCNDDTVMYDFALCAGPAPLWTTSPELEIVTFGTEMVVVRPIDANVNGNAFIYATIGDRVIQKRVWVGGPSMPSNIYGPTDIHQGSEANYYATPVIGAENYTWLLPDPFDPETDIVEYIQGNTDQWQMLVPYGDGRYNFGLFTGNAGYEGFVKARAENNCGESEYQELYVTQFSDGPCYTCNAPLQIVPIPNSANAEFKLHFENHPPGTYYIYIFDANSNIMYQGETTNVEKTVNTSNIPPGNYFLHIHDGEQVTSQQLIIER